MADASGVAQGAAAGAAVGGPWGALIGGASSLFGGFGDIAKLGGGGAGPAGPAGPSSAVNDSQVNAWFDSSGWTIATGGSRAAASTGSSSLANLLENPVPLAIAAGAVVLVVYLWTTRKK